MSRQPPIRRSPGVACPYCQSALSTRSSRAITPTFREVRYDCRNDECGAVLVGSISLTHVIVPSALAGAPVDLPIAVRARVTLPAANDDAPVRPQPANDTVMSETG